MRRFYLFLLLHLACQQYDPEAFQLTADFQPNERIYVVFVPNESVIELIVTLSRYENTGIFVKSEEEKAIADSICLSLGADMPHLQFTVLPNLDIWVRDNGPAILRNRDGQLRAVDFRSNVMEFEHNDKGIATMLDLPMVRARVMSLGGTRESNGEGVVLMTENFYEGQKVRLRKEHIEKDLKEHCGIREVVWLKKGLVEDELFNSGPVYQNIYPAGTGGHIDEFCRFVNPNTILLAQVESEDLNKHPLYQENNKRLEENYSLLEPLRKKGFKVIRIPTAEFVFRQEADPNTGSVYDMVSMSSYLNFVIGNHAIIVAKYFEDGMPESVRRKDEKVKQILQEQFPDHTIVQLNPKHLNARGGGYHCLSFNVPAK